MSRGGSLHDRADDGENCRKNQVVAATNPVSDHTSAEGTNETSALQGSDDVSLKVGELNLCHRLAVKAVSPTRRVSWLRGTKQIWWAILLLEGRHGQDTANDTGIHSEQHTTKASLSPSADVQITIFGV
jgi:hypothetical protein